MSGLKTAVSPTGPTPTATPADDDQLLLRRLRAGCWIILASSSLLTVEDIWLHRPDMSLLLAIKAIQIGLLVVLLWATHLPLFRRHLVLIGLLGVAVTCAASAILGVLRHDLQSTRVVLVVIALASAAWVPWGLRPQVGVAAIAALCLALNGYMLTGRVWAAFEYSVAGLVVGFAVLLYVAYELARQRAAIRRSEAYFRSLIENAPDLVSVLDADGTVAYDSPAHERVLGYTPAERVGASTPALVHPDDLPRVLDALHRDLREPGATVRIEFRYRHKDGSWRDMEAVGHNLLDDPAVGGIVVNSRDVTERRRMEEAMQRAKLAAESASRAKSEFLANMSHEIRTPLNGVIGMIGLALGSSPTAEQREYLDMAGASADALLAVINDILDFSKIEAGKLDVERVDFDVRHWLHDTMNAVTLAARSKGLALHCRVADSVSERVLGDPARLRQILLNLVGNAIKFTEHGSVTVDVATAEHGGAKGSAHRPAPPADGGHAADVELHVAVHDTGIGIPRDKQLMIFQAFTQADSSTARRYGGTGLGLTISARLVAMMGGRMWVESEVARGSTFHFTALVGRSPGAAASVRPEERAEQPPPAPAAPGPRRVLVAEDNLVNQKLITRLLERRGHTVVVAGTGREALAALAREPFDIVLMDVQMPEMDGLEATVAIRAQEDGNGTHLPIVALTAHAMKGDRDHCLEVGMDSYLAKPIQPVELFAVIEAPLPGAGARNTSRAA